MKLQLSAILLTCTLVNVAVLAADDPNTKAPAVSQTIVVTPPVPAAPPVTVQRLGDTVRVINTGPAQAVVEVVKMSDAGVDEKAILTYVASAPPIVLRADDIIYLHEHGISTGVITTMLQHAPQVQIAQTPVAPMQAQPQPQAPAAAYYPAPVEQPVYVPTPVYNAPYPYYDYSYYPYYPSIVIGGSFGFGRPFFHGGFHHFPTFRGGFHSGFGGGFHTVSRGGFHGGFHHR